MEKRYTPAPGDLCKYMSRVLLILGNPYLREQPHSPSGKSREFVDSIEIDDSTIRSVRCDALTLIQRAKENNDDN